MRKIRCCLLMMLILWAAGCAADKPTLTREQIAKIPFPQRTGLPSVSGGFALTVGGETVTVDDVITGAVLADLGHLAAQTSLEDFKRQAREPVDKLVTGKLARILLLQQARKEAPQNVEESLEKAADTEVRMFVLDFGGDYAKAEQAIEQMGMNWQSFREYQKKMILGQSYIASQVPKDEPVTYSMIMSEYNRQKKLFTTPAVITFRLIDIETEKLQTAEIGEDKAQAAKELADELMDRLRAGEDFAELAKEYSNDHRRDFGGLWEPVQPASLAEPYNLLAAEAEKIEPGQLAGPVYAPGHIFIMKLEQKQPEIIEPFEKVRQQIESKIIIERRRKAIDDIERKIVGQAALAQKEQFVDFCLEQIYRRGGLGEGKH